MADLVIDGGVATHSNDWSGDGKIHGIVKDTVSSVATVARRRVDLYHNSQHGPTGRIIATTYSRESDGYYEFLNLRIHPDPDVFDFSVVVVDWPLSSSVHESKIARWVRPEPM